MKTPVAAPRLLNLLPPKPVVAPQVYSDLRLDRRVPTSMRTYWGLLQQSAPVPCQP